ncbi:MAG: ribonuclease HI [Hydrogenobaculum sp.]
MEIKIYTDGSCLGNPGPGGYCAILKAIKNGKVVKEKIIKGTEANTTNNRMELKAVIEALKALSKKDQKITLYTDSQYVANGIKLWLKNWIKKDFKDVKNEDLWKELYELLKNQNIEVVWLRGHQKNKGDDYDTNNLCDKIAKEEAMKVRKETS